MNMHWVTRECGFGVETPSPDPSYVVSVIEEGSAKPGVLHDPHPA